MKRLVTAILAALLIAACVPMNALAAQLPFNDVKPSDWYYPYVERLLEQGMTSGVSQNRYAPADSVTAAQVVTFIARYLGLEEDAKKLGEQALAKSLAGAGLWYSGYVQLAVRAGYMQSERYGLAPTQDGLFGITAESSAMLEAPVTRIDVFEMIARSLELDNSAVRSRAVPAEAGGGLGHELIVGGGYDPVSLARYKEDIADIDAIAPARLEWVQKLMYNGIINGDDRGKINPSAGITRAEIAKVIAAVSNYDLRSRKEYRRIPDGLSVGGGDYVTSPRTGDIVLSPANAEAILRSQAETVRTSSASAGYILEYRLENIAPAGYIIQAIPLLRSGIRFVEISTRLSPDVAGSAWYPLTKRVNPTLDDTLVVFVLRNVSKGGRIEGKLTCLIDTAMQQTVIFES